MLLFLNLILTFNFSSFCKEFSSSLLHAFISEESKDLFALSFIVVTKMCAHCERCSECPILLEMVTIDRRCSTERIPCRNVDTSNIFLLPSLLVFHRNSQLSFQPKFLANATPILFRTGAEACENLRPDLHSVQCQNQKIGSKSDETKQCGSKSEIRWGRAESASAMKYRVEFLQMIVNCRMQMFQCTMFNLKLRILAKFQTWPRSVSSSRLPFTTSNT